MKMRYNVNTELFEYCDRLTCEGIFYIQCIHKSRF